MKLLLLLILAALGWLWWRHVRVSGRAADRQPPGQPSRPQPGTPQAMVDCPVCGLHLPQADAVTGRLWMYCSEDHRARHEG